MHEISDRAEIAEVLIRYTRAIDTGEWDRLDTVFTPDADIDYTESGGLHDGFATVKPWLAEVLPAFFPQRMHTLGQIETRFSGPDAATVAAYFHNPMPADDGAGGTKVVEFGGIYHHEMVRTPEGWRSRRLHEQIVWKRGM